MMRNTTLATAMHEAGHAVVQLANPTAPYIDSISIVGLPDGLLGLVDTSAQWQPYIAEVTARGAVVPPEILEGWRRLARQDIIVHLAGTIAELRWRRRSSLTIALSGTHFAEHCLGGDRPEPGTDFDRVRVRLTWAYPGEELEQFLGAWRETEEAVAANWRAIRSIGRTLHQRGHITGKELRECWIRTQAEAAYHKHYVE